jgi:hypothetical protein
MQSAGAIIPEKPPADSRDDFSRILTAVESLCAIDDVVGGRDGAAARLDIPPTTLLHKMRELTSASKCQAIEFR